MKLTKSCKRKGFIQRPSHYLEGIVDTAAPILRNGKAIASLTAPCLLKRGTTKADQEKLVQQVLETAQSISDELALVGTTI